MTQITTQQTLELLAAIDFMLFSAQVLCIFALIYIAIKIYILWTT